ncbi:dienelactone hydrolase family protein [Pseudomassariella vexata]|uniref:Dienelactone hydrolase family protein n=1 Tax=Pseudomassariella vexata TaxID=1141098 RepID=A0A1Y2DRP9_9PEZI|nr:dienelactone hydrolase family protein [Pseudomassariella vexata]ORY61776.1 dienelactone hydrolase family protein [Pseudomassariella vexata]
MKRCQIRKQVLEVAQSCLTSVKTHKVPIIIIITITAMSCSDCFNGAIHEGKPTGTITRLHGINTYMAEPASGLPSKGIVVIIPDAFGWDFVNIRLMADNYARKKDYRVYAPDFMNGHSAPLWMINTLKGVQANKTWWDLMFKPYHYFWLIYGLGTFMTNNRFGKSFPMIKDWLTIVRRNEAAHLPLGVAGFCWGGKHVVLLAENFKADGKPLMDAGFACHPSQLSFYEDIKKARVPVSFAVGDHDIQMSVAQAEEIRKMVEAKPDGQKGEVKVYAGYGHGFGCRVDTVNEDPKGADEAENQGLAWFEAHFAKVSYA